MAGGVREFDPERLVAAQTRAGLSVRQLAHVVGVSPDVVFRWRRGARRPFPRHLVGLAAALRCRPAALAPLPQRPRLGHYRERAGLTQAEMGGLLGTTANIVLGVEKADLWPDDPAWWAEAYGISVRTFTRAWRHAAGP
jgi:transcriptional regulator with XRE-family HTH domain